MAGEPYVSYNQFTQVVLCAKHKKNLPFESLFITEVNFTIYEKKCIELYNFLCYIVS